MAIAVCIRRLFPVAAMLMALAVGARAATSGGNVTNFTVNGNSSSPIQVMAGLNAKLLITCRMTYNTSAPIVHIRKTDASNRTWSIAENDELAADLPSTWSVDATDVLLLPPKTAEYNVTIEPVQNGDSGNYSCSVGSSTVKNVIQVDVITEPTVATMTFNGQLLTPGQMNMVQVTIRQEYLVTCNISGGNPYPSVNVSTSKGQLTPYMTSYNMSAQSTAVNVGSVSRSTNATVKVTFDVWMLGKPVTCSGGVKNPMAISTSFTAMSDAVVPQFQCDDRVMYPKNVMDLVITCQVLAPNLTSSYVRWINSTKNINTVVGNLASPVTFVNDSRYVLRVTPPAYGSQGYTMILTVKNAHDIKDLSSNSYQFVAISSNGQALHSVTVQQDVGYAGGASPSVLSTVSYLLTLLIAAAAAALMM